jgi:membrane-bound metal-dependent hydrolase YbcI (DUF457 family)
VLVGHAALAFGVAGLVALRAGLPRERALSVAVAAGLFATVPDVDVLYALTGLAGTLGADALTAADAFWTASTAVHRTMTHSLVVAVPATAAFALWPRDGRARLAAAVCSLGLVAVAAGTSGALGAGVMATFVLAGLGVGTWAARRGLDACTVAAAALLGLASHPFGDVFTGEVPAFLYPLDATLLAGRVGPFADPTLDLLVAFGVELAAIWLGVAVAARLADTRLRDHVSPRAAVGAGYALAAVAIPAPTLSVSYHFVFSVVAVGFVGAVPERVRDGPKLPDRHRAAVTGLAAVTLAVVGYALAYLIVHA